MTAAPAKVRATPLTPEAVVLLQSVRSYPSVSLLMTTTPGARLSPDDARTLHRLAEVARERLATDGSPAAGVVADVLGETVRAAARGPVTQGLGVFVNAGNREILRLPVPVADRVVVDPTFATRDLVRSLHRTPRHVVLVLTEREARLFDAVRGRLEPAARSPFPLLSPAARPDPRPADVDSFFRRVDRALGTYRRLHPSPLVLVGTERTLSRFREVSRNLDRLAGAVTGSHARTPLRTLAPQVRQVLDRYLRSREQEALELAARRDREQRLVEGMSGAWLAARAERPEMLLVEEGFAYPARISADGDFLSPAEDVEHPDVVDDAVDELVELVMLRGGWVAFAADGALADRGRIVLTVR